MKKDGGIWVLLLPAEHIGHGSYMVGHRRRVL